MECGATFSPCRRYRYTLWRRWTMAASADSKGMLNFLMLNPSTADERQNDPTVERCQRRAMSYGHSGLYVTNIFALRSTDPQKLYEVEQHPVGPENDAEILRIAKESALVVCGWGNHGKHLGRGRAVIELLRANGITPHALTMTGEGQPGHPLYVPYSKTPAPI